MQSIRRSLFSVLACLQLTNFRREETASCSDEVIFADFQKSADLPTGETVVTELPPKERDEFGFACLMGMFRGRLVVE